MDLYVLTQMIIYSILLKEYYQKEKGFKKESYIGVFVYECVHVCARSKQILGYLSQFSYQCKLCQHY